jgi:hypothetical protein
MPNLKKNSAALVLKYRAIKKKSLSHEYHDSVGSAGLHIPVIDNRQVFLLEIRGLKCF